MQRKHDVASLCCTSYLIQPFAMSDSLSLNCLVLGDDPDKMFTLKIPKTENVSILKSLIKKARENSSFRNVDSKNIDLWSVDFCLDELEVKLVHVNLDNHPELSARMKLSSYFKGTVDDECASGKTSPAYL